MTLTKEDLQAITNALDPQFDGLAKSLRIEIINRERGMREEIRSFRDEVRQLFKGQAEQLSKAIKDATNLMAKEREEARAELEELRDELEDYKKRLEKLEQRVYAP